MKLPKLNYIATIFDPLNDKQSHIIVRAIYGAWLVLCICYGALFFAMYLKFYLQSPEENARFIAKVNEIECHDDPKLCHEYTPDWSPK